MEKLKCEKTWRELNWGGKLGVGVYLVGKILMLKEKVVAFRHMEVFSIRKYFCLKTGSVKCVFDTSLQALLLLGQLR